MIPRALIALALLFAVSHATAAPVEINLSNEELTALPEETRSLVLQARQELAEDNFPGGFRLLLQAANGAEESVALQLALAEISIHLARTQFQNDAPRLLEVVNEVTERVEGAPGADPEDIARAQRLRSTMARVVHEIEQARWEAENAQRGRELIQDLAETEWIRREAEEAQRAAEAAARRPPPSSESAPSAPAGDSRRYMQAIQDSRNLRDSSQP
ncbi:hypothetical protein JXA47_16945 [Candidatus Sumerlaeota bacterium]|nr:hypothetical protein [Candidatus Sumerlaeota bacterium]